MEEQILKTIEEYNMIESGDRVVLGVSGGPDSISMLDILNKIKNKINFEIVVAHINHKIREEAGLDAQYVLNFCNDRKIECFIKEIEVLELSKKKKISTEEAGRIARYEFFEEILEKTKSDKIATAHTLNDNAETVIMNLLRGSGTSGLKGIQEVRGHYIRPLIKCSRNQIEEYCEKNNLKPRIDKTNMENIYTRNKIRNELIPYLEKDFNPNIIQTLSRLSDIIKEENSYLDKKTKEAFAECNIKNENNIMQIVLDLKKFNSFELVIKNRIVLYTINKLLRKRARYRKSSCTRYNKVM